MSDIASAMIEKSACLDTSCRPDVCRSLQLSQGMPHRVMQDESAATSSPKYFSATTLRQDLVKRNLEIQIEESAI